MRRAMHCAAEAKEDGGPVPRFWHLVVVSPGLGTTPSLCITLPTCIFWGRALCRPAGPGVLWVSVPGWGAVLSQHPALTVPGSVSIVSIGSWKVTEEGPKGNQTLFSLTNEGAESDHKPTRFTRRYGFTLSPGNPPAHSSHISRGRNKK